MVYRGNVGCRLSDIMSGGILSYSVAECDAKLREFEELWTLYEGGPSSAPTLNDIFARVVKNLQAFETNNQCMAYLDRVSGEAAQLYTCLLGSGDLANDPTLNARADKVLNVLGGCVCLVKVAHRAQQALDNNTSGDTGASLYSFNTMTRANTDELKVYQRLLLHLTCTAHLHGYRRYGDSVWKPLLTADGYNTHSWEKVCDIRGFVYRSCQKEYNFDEWQMLTDHPSHSRNAVAYLTDCEDVQFPRLQKDRSAFSCSNGIYLARDDQFVTYGQADSPISSNLSCAKYFDTDVPLECARQQGAAWRAIPTPSLDSILLSQQLEEAVRDWMYVFLGRLLYEVGDRDNW